MQIELDPTKDAENIAKHGVSLALAGSLEWDLLLATKNTRERYGDVRMIGFAPIGRKVYCVVFTEAGDIYRIISLRKALPKSVRNFYGLVVATPGDENGKLELPRLGSQAGVWEPEIEAASSHLQRQNAASTTWRRTVRSAGCTQPQTVNGFRESTRAGRRSDLRSPTPHRPRPGLFHLASAPFLY